LFLKGYIFDFASDYKLKHVSIGDPAKFKLTDMDFDDFAAFVKSKNVAYKTESEDKLEALKDASTDEKYFDALKSQYEAVKKKLEQDKEQDLLKNRQEIITVLENEIAGRYYYA